MSGNVRSTSCLIVARSSVWANQVFQGDDVDSDKGSQPSLGCEGEPRTGEAIPREVWRTEEVEVSDSSNPEQSEAHRPSGAIRYRRLRAL